MESVCNRSLPKYSPLLAVAESLHNGGLKLQRHSTLRAFGRIREQKLAHKKGDERNDVALLTLFDRLVSSYRWLRYDIRRNLTGLLPRSTMSVVPPLYSGSDRPIIGTRISGGVYRVLRSFDSKRALGSDAQHNVTRMSCDAFS